MPHLFRTEVGVMLGLVLLLINLVGIDGSFDVGLEIIGREEVKKSTRLRKKGFLQIRSLGVDVDTGCGILIRQKNATLEVRTKAGRVGWLDLPSAEKSTLENEESRIRAPLLCRLRYAKKLQHKHRKEIAFITSVSDLSYLWKYWRWILNKMCFAHSRGYPYYLFIGAPQRNQPRVSTECPAKIEEPLAHTTKALSLFTALSLRLAPRFIFLDADVWYSSILLADTTKDIWPQWIQATANANLALPAPCYRQFFGAAIVAVRASDWTMGLLAKWFDLRCGPKDQPSLWHLVLSTAGQSKTARNVLKNYHDPRCLNATTGELTKADCQNCAPRQCGYYAAWQLANDAFFDLWGSKGNHDGQAIVDTSRLFAVSQPLFTPGLQAVAYLPNQGPLSLLCSTEYTKSSIKDEDRDEPPLRHIKWLRKSQRDLPAHLCGELPVNLYFKGPRDADF